MDRDGSVAVRVITKFHSVATFSLDLEETVTAFRADSLVDGDVHNVYVCCKDKPSLWVLLGKGSTSTKIQVTNLKPDAPEFVLLQSTT